MGLFKKYHDLAGDIPNDLAESQLVGRGDITQVEKTNVVAGSDADPHPVCIFTVHVRLDGEEPYTATCRQHVPIAMVPQLSTGAAVVAVRVNPQDHSEIALALDVEPPVVTLPPSTGQSAADMLATGRRSRSVIVSFEPMGTRSQAGIDIYLLVLSVMDGAAPRQVTIGNAVPSSAVPLMFPGANVPVKIGVLDDDVVVDWGQALDDFSQRDGS